MITRIKTAWREDDGVLSFEWVLLLTLLTIGIVSGVTAARDAITDELADVAEAAISIDQSYTLAGYMLGPITVVGSGYDDDTAADLAAFMSCDRTSSPLGQGPQFDP